MESQFDIPGLLPAQRNPSILVFPVEQLVGISDSDVVVIPAYSGAIRDCARGATRRKQQLALVADSFPHFYFYCGDESRRYFHGFVCDLRRQSLRPVRPVRAVVYVHQFVQRHESSGAHSRRQQVTGFRPAEIAPLFVGIGFQHLHVVVVQHFFAGRRRFEAFVRFARIIQFRCVIVEEISVFIQKRVQSLVLRQRRAIGRCGFMHAVPTVLVIQLFRGKYQQRGGRQRGEDSGSPPRAEPFATSARLGRQAACRECDDRPGERIREQV